MTKNIILPPGYYTNEDAEEVYDKTFDITFQYFLSNFIKGKILEFGTYKGYSARKIACKMKKYNIINDFYMFDSFEGLPEITSNIDSNSYQVKTKDWKKGTFGSAKGFELDIKKDVSKLIGIEKTHIVKGFFDKTLQDIKLTKESVIFVNIDCDLYSSIYLVLDKLITSEVFQDGSIIFFDDYNFNRANMNMGVRKAIQETFEKQTKYTLEQFFVYGWHGRAFFIHDNKMQEGENNA